MGIFPVGRLVAAQNFWKGAYSPTLNGGDAAKGEGKNRIRLRTYPQLHRSQDHQDLYPRLFRWLMAGTAVFLAVVAILCAARSFYQPYAQKRQVAAADACLTAGDYARAAIHAQEALRTSPTDLPACQAMADAATLGHLPSELYWVQRLTDVAPTMANKLRLAETGLRCQAAPFPVTSGMVNDLAETAANNLAYHVIAGKLAVSLHQPAEAEAHFAAAVQLDPTNPQNVLNLATLHLGSANPAVQQQARAELENLGADGTVGLAALRALVADRQAGGDNRAASHFSDQLLALPQATLSDRLENLEILQGMNAVMFKQRLQAAKELAAANVQLVNQLATWMQFHGLAEASLDWLNSLPESMEGELAYKMAMLQGYLQSGQWQSVINGGNRDNWSGEDFLRLAMLAHAWNELGEPTLAESTWGQAVKQAANRCEAMATLMTMAERWQMSDQQQDLSHRIQLLAAQ